jgi:hypothetical protein
MADTIAKRIDLLIARLSKERRPIKRFSIIFKRLKKRKEIDD